VYLHDVSKFDQKDGVFDVDLELWAKWLGDFEPEKLIIANAAEVERVVLGQESDGLWRSARTGERCGPSRTGPASPCSRKRRRRSPTTRCGSSRTASSR